MSCQIIIHRLDFHHWNEIFFDVTRWQRTHLLNTFFSEVEIWLESKKKWFTTIILRRFVFFFQIFSNRDKTSTRRYRTMLIKTINTKRLFFNELFIYRKNDNEWINKDFIITKTSRIHQWIEIRRCRIFD